MLFSLIKVPVSGRLPRVLYSFPLPPELIGDHVLLLVFLEFSGSYVERPVPHVEEPGVDVKIIAAA
jgi:hypothetical protein